jgi:bifunctional non-homologous end joining protein LigD
LVYAGQVGTGFTDEMLRDLLSQLQRSERKTSPFDPEVPRADARQAHWVTPKLVGEVAFTEWTPDGRLRHPSWRGLRPDKSADQVQRET